METFAQPQVGDVFREIRWFKNAEDGFLRVGGNFSYCGSKETGCYLTLEEDVDLEHAIKAEVMVEKLLSHEATKDLRIRWNDSSWIKLTPPSTIP